LRHTFSLASVLFLAWLIWSGHFTPFLIGLGVGSVILVVLLFRRMGLVDDESVPLSLGLRPLLYAPWLLLEIVKSNLQVARIVLDPRLPIRPRLLKIPAEQKTELGKVIYANSITLTPGTVSIDLEGEEVCVHALTDAAADGLREGGMGQRVCRLEARR